MGKATYFFLALIILALFFGATKNASASSDKTVVVPVLMYHHIGDKDSIYYISEADFELQMRTLYDLGYHTITATQLAEAITKGKKLPVRPIVITFDDGNPSVYSTAFPIMQKYDFVGVAYVVTSYIWSGYGLSVDQLKDMVKHGWEVGSHTSSHADLTKPDKDLNKEIATSRSDLERMLKVKVKTFAYPFGAANFSTTVEVSEHYILGMGVWGPSTHSSLDLFYLGRISINRGEDIIAFKAKLPWTEPINTKVK